MSDQQLSKGDVHKIVTDKLSTHKVEIHNKLDDLEREGKETTTILTAVRLDQEKIKGKLDAIYGNGSGKKGILDRLEDKQDASDKKVTKLEETVIDEVKKQATFRHDIRNTLESMMLKRKEDEDARIAAAAKLEEERKQQAEEIKEEKKDKHLWWRWILGGIGIAVWTCISEFIKRHHWLGF